MASKQNMVTNQRRYVTKVNFFNESAGVSFGITGGAFNAMGSDGEPYVAGITASTATISRIYWTASGTTNGYAMKWGPDTANGATAIYCYGANGEFQFEKMTLKNNATVADGFFHIIPTGTVTGTVILEFAL